MLLASASRVLSNSLGASSRPAWKRRSTTLSSACWTQARCAPSGLRSCASLRTSVAPTTSSEVFSASGGGTLST